MKFYVKGILNLHACPSLYKLEPLNVFFPLYLVGPCVIHPQVNFAELGGSVTFTCNAANVPGEFFRWRKGIGGSEEIRNDSRHSSVSVTGSSQLTIKNINVDDQGYYVCDVDKINPPCSDRGYLQVLRKFGFIV